MKKLFFGLLAVGLLSLSSFTTDNSVEQMLHYCHYNILNADGIVIVNQKFSNEKDLKIITPNAIKSGLYLLKITSNGSSTISKIILNK